MRSIQTCLCFLSIVPLTSALIIGSSTSSPRFETKISACNKHVTAGILGLSIGCATLLGPSVSWADEYGVEREAPTLYTGETVEICKRRGPLGACLETEMRTEINDNDRAKRYFRDPKELVLQKEQVLRGSESPEGNALVEKLRQQSIDNKEKNDLYVARKTFENDQAANFGPFDRQVVIMNTDEKTFTLLENPQAMRLKKAGFIEGRRFIKQPTEEELQNAMEAEGPGLAESLLGAFGGSK